MLNASPQQLPVSHEVPAPQQLPAGQQLPAPQQLPVSQQIPAPQSPPAPVLPPAPEGWSVHEDGHGNYFYLTPVITRTGQRHKISKGNHAAKLIQTGDIDANCKEGLVFKKSMFLVNRVKEGNYAACKVLEVYPSFLEGEGSDGAVGQNRSNEEDSNTGVLCALQTNPLQNT